MFKKLLNFNLLLFAAAGAIYLIHYALFQFLNLEGTHEVIIFSYKFNVGITLLFTSSMILASEQLKEQLGFIYLLSGFIKIGIFLYLIKTSQHDIDKSVFLHFFVPYVVCVVVEIIYIIKLLNNANFSQDK